MLRIVTILFFMISAFVANAQRMTPEEYIAKYKNDAIEEMHRSGVPASVTLGQGLLETENGNSELVQKSNNHFGIKCKSDWKGESVKHTDDAPDECFRKYASAQDSYADHSNYLKTSSRYASLFALDPYDYKGWAKGLKRAGYATNPRYPEILIGNIEKYQLYQYDKDIYDPSLVFSPGIFKDSAKENKVITMIAAPPSAFVENNGSEKVKYFNGLRAVFANANTSLLAIATKAGISLSRLLEFNDLKKDGLLPEGQYIYLEKKEKEGKKDFYVSTERQSLYDIAQANGVQLSAIAQYNELSPDATVNQGARIKLKPVPVP